MNAAWMEKYLVCAWDERSRGDVRERGNRSAMDQHRQDFGADVLARARSLGFPSITLPRDRGPHGVSLVLGFAQAWEALCELGNVHDVADAMLELDRVEAPRRRPAGARL